MLLVLFANDVALHSQTEMVFKPEGTSESEEFNPFNYKRRPRGVGDDRPA